MTLLQEYWTRMADMHGFKVDIPFEVFFPDGGKITVDVRLKGYGAVNGMLIVSDEGALAGKSDEIVEMGYGYSCVVNTTEGDEDP